MAQPPASGSGRGEEPARDPGLPGDPGGGAPGSRGTPGTPGSSGTPGGAPAGGRPGRDPRLAGFAQDGPGDTCRPGPELAATVAALSGPDWRCSGASDDELTGLLGRWNALESWAAAGKLGVARELIRRRELRGTGSHAGLPDAWDDSLSHELTPALAISLPAADKLANLAWELGARLPGIGAALADGTISCPKASLIVKELTVLDDARIAEAEAMLLPELAGKTPGELARLAALAVDTVDPEGARKRRERAEREDARVRVWREHSGAATMAAYGLPADAALSANANVNQRAQEYKSAGICPEARMDQLRVLAFADILNGVSAADRIARAQAEAEAKAPASAQNPASAQDPTGPGVGSGPGGSGPADDGSTAGDGSGDDVAGPADGGQDDGRPGGGDPGDDGSGPGDGPGDDTPRPDGSPGDGGSGPGDGSGPSDGPGDGGGSGLGNGGPGGPRNGGNGGGSAPGAGPAGPSGPVLPARSNLTLPLATLLGLAERPGEAHGLGVLDPALVRDLAAAAARSPHSDWCVTITDDNGYAIGHGCAKPARTSRKQPQPPPAGNRDGPWAFTRTGDPGPPDGYGTWTLTLPGGRELTLQLGLVPVTDCDHRHEARGYQPGDTLRHLVQIRDGTCTFPGCSRHARESDFEHAVPYHRGGKTCACNAGARSRRCQTLVVYSFRP